MTSECSACKSVVLVTQKRIKCTKCLFVYHLECVCADPNPPPRSNWVCPICVAAARKGGDNSNTPVRMHRPFLEAEVVACSPEMQTENDRASSCGTYESDNAILIEIKSLRAEMINQFQLQDKKLDSFNQIISTMRAEVDGVKTTVDILQANCQHYEDSLIRQREKIAELESSLNEIKSSLTFISSQYDEMTLDFKKHILDLQNENKTLQKDMVEINTRYKLLTEHSLLKEQQGRYNNLEISGVPFHKGENLLSLLTLIASKVGFSLLPSDIDYIHRVRRYPRKNLKTSSDSTSNEDEQTQNIICRFTQRYRKNEMLAAVRARRGLTTADVGIDGAARPVFVNDHLAPHNKMLYGRARRAGHELGYKYIWLSDCKIFLRKSDTSKAILISNEDDLCKIK